MKQTILIDMDGVVADFVGGIIDGLATHGIDFDRTKIDDFAYADWAEDHMRIAKETAQAPGFFRSLSIAPGAVEAIRALQEAYTVRFCSSPLPINKTCESEKRDWIEHYFDKQLAGDAFIGPDKTLCQGDVLIDDKPNVTGVQTPSWQHIVFDQTWNQGSESPRLFSWTDTSIIESVMAGQNATVR